jgi:phosphoribosyl 1,2-cyclic phosphate phosphodiesterase
MVNDDLLIDFGPDVMSASFLHNVFVNKVRYLLQTHAHSDHFDAGHITTRISEYAVEGVKSLSVYASSGTLEKMSIMFRRLGYLLNFLEPEEQRRIDCEVITLEPSKISHFGKYDLLPIASNHDPDEESLIYAIRQGEKAILYGTDTDCLSNNSLKVLAECGWKFDGVILDHTYGWNIDGGGHLNANKFVKLVYFMRANNLLKEEAQILATHISHEGNPPHEEFNSIAAEYGYEAAYDGLVIEF